MELKDFVSNSIVQICEAIKDAQKRTEELGAFVSPRMMPQGAPSLPHQAAFGGLSTIFFDIALEAEDISSNSDKDKAGAGLKVLGSHIGVDGENITNSSERQTNTSHIKFEIRVMWPSVQYIDRDYKGPSLSPSFNK